MLGVKPYLSFAGNCAEAIHFYADALDAEIQFCQTFGESPMKGSAPDDKIMHCTVRVGDTFLMACDSMSPENPVRPGNQISLALGADDAKAAEAMFGKMSDGAVIVMPLQETFWAERFGILQDKFGIQWMFNVSKAAGDNAEAAD